MKKLDDLSLRKELINYYARQVFLGQTSVYKGYKYDVVDNDKLRAVKYLKYQARNPIYIPDIFEVIGDECFSRCRNLQGIYLGKNIKKLGYRPFEGCYKLYTLEFNDNLQDLGDFILSSTYVSSLSFPDSLVHFDSIEVNYSTFLKQISFGRNICLYEPFDFKKLKLWESDEAYIENIYFTSDNLSLVNFYAISNFKRHIIINNKDFTEYLTMYNSINYKYINGKHYVDGMVYNG